MTVESKAWPTVDQMKDAFRRAWPNCEECGHAMAMETTMLARHWKCPQCGKLAYSVVRRDRD